MRCIAIMQPTYLPWMGYFDLMDQVDAFVLLDDVELSKQSWQQRNRIRTQKGLEWLTVPVRVKGKLHQKLNEARIVDNAGFPRKHLAAIEQSYRRSAWFARYYDALAECLLEGAKTGTLSALNARLIGWLAGQLGIGTRTLTGSSLQVAGKRSERLVAICKRLEADRYLSPLGARAYLQQEQACFDEAGIEVQMHNFSHPQYRQLYEPFLEYASVVDLLFNVGDAALEVIRSGRGSPVGLAEACP